MSEEEIDQLRVLIIKASHRCVLKRHFAAYQDLQAAKHWLDGADVRLILSRRTEP